MLRLAPPMHAYKAMSAKDWCLDIIAVIISLSDVATDYWVCYQYYETSHRTFFWITFSLIVSTHMVYSGAFVKSYLPYNMAVPKQLLVFICVLPVSSLFSVLCWLDTIGIIVKPMERIGILTYCRQLPNQHDENGERHSDYLATWMAYKWEAYVGYLFEALIESCPQAIIQLIYVVLYQNPSPVNIVSILLSLTSIISKGFMFCYCVDVKVLIFNWLCICIDILGCFSTISWVFTFITTADNGIVPSLFYYLSVIFIARFIFCTLPFAIWMTWFQLFGNETVSHSINRLYSHLEGLPCCYIFCSGALLFMSVFVCFATVIVVMLFEIISLSFVTWLNFGYHQNCKATKAPFIARILPFLYEVYPSLFECMGRCGSNGLSYAQYKSQRHHQKMDFMLRLAMAVRVSSEFEFGRWDTNVLSTTAEDSFGADISSGDPRILAILREYFGNDAYFNPSQHNIENHSLFLNHSVIEMMRPIMERRWNQILRRTFQTMLYRPFNLILGSGMFSIRNPNLYSDDYATYFGRHNALDEDSCRSLRGVAKKIGLYCIVPLFGVSKIVTIVWPLLYTLLYITAQCIGGDTTQMITIENKSFLVFQFSIAVLHLCAVIIAVLLLPYFIRFHSIVSWFLCMTDFSPSETQSDYAVTIVLHIYQRLYDIMESRTILHRKSGLDPYLADIIIRYLPSFGAEFEDTVNMLANYGSNGLKLHLSGNTDSWKRASFVSMPILAMSS